MTAQTVKKPVNKTSDEKVQMKPEEVLQKTIKALQEYNVSTLTNKAKRTEVKEMFKTLVRMVCLLIVEKNDDTKLPAYYQNILKNNLARVQALKSKQAAYTPILAEALQELTKEPIDTSTPVSLLAAAKFITNDIDYEVVNNEQTPATKKPIAADAPTEPVAKVGVEVRKNDEIIEATIEVSSTDQEPKFVEDIFNEAPENEHHMDLTDDTSLSVDEKTAEVFFYDKDGNIVATSKLKRMGIRWGQTAKFFLMDIFDSFKKLFFAIAGAAGVIIVQAGLTTWQIVKSPYTAYKEAKRLKAEEWYDSGNPPKFA